MRTEWLNYNIDGSQVKRVLNDTFTSKSIKSISLSVESGFYSS